MCNTFIRDSNCGSTVNLGTDLFITSDPDTPGAFDTASPVI